jgi:hypothetical protein
MAGTYGHGGAWRTQAWIDPMRAVSGGMKLVESRRSEVPSFSVGFSRGSPT